MSAWTVIAHTELGSAAATISFTSIPATYTDLFIAVSSRSAGSDPEDLYLQFNGDTGANYSFRRLYGSGSSVASDAVASNATAGRVGRVNSGNYTGSTFSSTGIYIPNYLSSVAKSISSDTVEENNATQAFQMIFATIWSGTSAITSVDLKVFSGVNFAQYSSATLFGILKGSSGGVSVS